MRVVSSRIFLLVIIFIILAFSIVELRAPAEPALPKDKELIESLHEHRAQFEKLRQMVSEDSSYQQRFIGSALPSSLNEDRKKQYNDLLRKIWTSLDIVKGYDDNDIYYVFASYGMSVGFRWEKGVLYSPADHPPAGKLVQSLDNAHVLPAGENYFRQIEPHWFVMYHRDE